MPEPLEGVPAVEIDLAALKANYRALAERAAPAECAGVVKADAYGVGLDNAVPALWEAGCRTFFVAHLSEAEVTRAFAPEAVIYVLNGLPPGLSAEFRAIEARPVLGSLAELSEWRTEGGVGPAALHVDTGMNRLGLSLPDLTQAVTFGRLAGLNLSLVLSHFVSSEVDGDPLNARQVEAFLRVRTLLPDVKASLANSSGLFLDPLPRFDLVRPGYALFGGNPTPARPNTLTPAATLVAPVVQVRTLEAGETVGYNAQWTARRPTRLATLSLGYADGFDRRAGGTDAGPRWHVLIAGRLCPIVGRVSMDLVTVDVTEAPRAEVERGVRAVILGGPDPRLSFEAFAAAVGTNGYEAMTRLAMVRGRRLVSGGEAG